MNKEGKRIGLALSGGGYRAAAYHIGTLRALRKLGILDTVDVISSVSGGSITAAYYALNKKNFTHFEQSLQTKLQHGVLGWTVICLVIEGLILLGLHGWLIAMVIDCASLCLIYKCAIIIGMSIIVLIIILLLLHKVVPTSKLIQLIYALEFFNCKKISDVPGHPILAINATDVEQNRLMTFSQTKVVSGGKYNDGYFKNSEIPLSLAVMASSAYPLFAPVQIPEEYLTKANSVSPILVDGGIYDNQGTHKLTENGDYHAEYIVVSDAGNTEMNRKGTWNIASLLYKIINMMMNRIEKMQRRDNLFSQKKYETKKDEDTFPHYAYVVLEWLPAEKDYVNRFIGNVSNELVPRAVCESHGLDKDIVERIIAEDAEALQIAKKRIEEHIGWEELYVSQPSKETIKTAKGVKTGLSCLSEKKINALVECAEWMTNVQVKLYMPELIPNE